MDKPDAIFNVAQVIEELVLNAIDGKATEISVHVDWGAFKITVSDNGCGMGKNQLKLVGKNPASRTPQQRWANRIYGQCDYSLYNIGRYSESLTITSQNVKSKLTHQVKIIQGVPMGLSKSSETRNSSGTVVEVAGYLYNLPTKKSQLDFYYQMKTAKTFIESLSLVHCQTLFELHDDNNQMTLCKTQRRQDTVEATRCFMPLSPEGKLIPLQKSSQHFRLKGLAVQVKHNTRPILYVNNRPVSSSRIYDLIDQFLGNEKSSLFLTVILNIKCSRSMYKILFSWKETTVEYCHWSELQNLIGKTIYSAQKFLRFHQDLPPPKTPAPERVVHQLQVLHLSSQENSVSGSESSRQNSTSQASGASKYFPTSPDSIKLTEWVKIRKKLVPNPPLIPPSPSFGRIDSCLHYGTQLLRSFESPHVVPGKSNSPRSLSNDWNECDDHPSEKRPRLHNTSTEVVSSQNPTLAPSTGSFQSTDFQNWVKIQNENGTYYVNTLSGHTSTTEPRQSEPIFEMRTKLRELPPVDLARLDVPNEFWVQHPQPMNVSKSKENHFAFQLDTRRLQCKFSRNVFSSLYVVNQIDQKFIGCLATDDVGTKYLILIDQHAAHERICLEKLIRHHSVEEEGGVVRIPSSSVQSALDLTFDTAQMDAIRSLTPEWPRLGLKLSVKAADTVSITHVPACFLERAVNSAKRGVIVDCHLLSETLILETLAEKAERGRLSSCLIPPTIRNVLNSVACRGAIKFGDQLTKKCCRKLVKGLSQCDVPFQCAHGRPLLVPLIQLADLDRFSVDPPRQRPQYHRLAIENK